MPGTVTTKEFVIITLDFTDGKDGNERIFFGSYTEIPFYAVVLVLNLFPAKFSAEDFLSSYLVCVYAIICFSHTFSPLWFLCRYFEKHVLVKNLFLFLEMQLLL